jgi:hypothetical protein
MKNSLLPTRSIPGLINSCDGNPLVDVRMGARHADVRLGGAVEQTLFGRR